MDLFEKTKLSFKITKKHENLSITINTKNENNKT